MADQIQRDPENPPESTDVARPSADGRPEDEEDAGGAEDPSGSESADDDLDQRNEEDPEDFSEESMDEADLQRHCTARTISANTGHRRQPHDIRPCRSVGNFKKLNLINEGTYGRVWRAQQTLRSGRSKINALKEVKMEKEKEGFPMTALREIHILLTLQHLNVVNVEEVVVGAKMDSIFLVMEYLPHDLKHLMENMRARFSQSEVKCLLVQLLKACCYMHDNWIIHRDLKTSNLLYSNNGVLKVCDFGLARLYGDPIKKMTPGVVTLWYRSPEILLGEESYDPAVDLWSVGCIFAEMLQKEPLFPGKTEVDMLTRIFNTLGTPTEDTWPDFNKLPNVKKHNFTSVPPGKLRELFPPTSLYSEKSSLTETGFELLAAFLASDPQRRISAAQALNHRYFLEVPPPQEVSLMPTFKATNEQPRKKRKRGADDPNRETKKALGVAV
uniref:Protein kinase domain-containing protein n=1 Tax=Eutreptiella gymnastica TaxID=73025 RepID=A0A7S4LAR1_9EUGL